MENTKIREQAEAFLAECSLWEACTGDEELTMVMMEGAEEQERKRVEAFEAREREIEEAQERMMREMEEREAAMELDRMMGFRR